MADQGNRCSKCSGEFRSGLMRIDNGHVKTLTCETCAETEAEVTEYQQRLVLLESAVKNARATDTAAKCVLAAAGFGLVWSVFHEVMPAIEVAGLCGAILLFGGFWFSEVRAVLRSIERDIAVTRDAVRTRGQTPHYG